MRLTDATWNDVEQLPGVGADGARVPIVLVPVGSTEQHGPHLPLATDTLIAQELADRATRRTEGLLVGPAIAVSASGEHADFPGTLSIGTQVMRDLVIELGRSADWAAGLVFVNAHGGNIEPMTAAVETLRSEGREVLAWWPRWPAPPAGAPRDLHAGRVETSLMLAIDPGLVRLQLAATGPDADLEELRRAGVRSVSPTGVLGDPAGASGGEGQRLIDEFVEDLAQEIERWRPLDPTPVG